jgi:poly(glycerol-phosphate) alpha-glucosyltransferase
MSGPTRIAHILPSLSPRSGGLYTVVSSLAKKSAECHVEIKVYGAQDVAEPVNSGAWAPAIARELGTKGPARFSYMPDLVRELEDYIPQIIHVHGIWAYPLIAAHQYARSHGVYRILSPHGMLDGWALDQSKWLKKVAGWAYQNRGLRSVDCIHALCEAEVEEIRRFGLHSPICVIPNGVEIVKMNLANDYSHPSWIRDIAGNKNVLLFLSRIHPKKGLANLLHAWQLVMKDSTSSIDEWILLIVGNDETGHMQELEQLKEQLGLQSRVFFLGPQYGREKAAIFSRADAFILPSLSEGMPAVVLEAWSYALPALITPQCNLQEGFEAGAAIKIEPDPDEIATVLKKFFVLPRSQREKIGRAGLSLVERHFDWRVTVQKMLATYRWLGGYEKKPDFVRTV